MTDTLTITNPIPMTNGGEGGGAGTAGGIFYINVVQGEVDQLTLDKTWNEIKTAIDNGMLPIMKMVTEGDGPFHYVLSIASSVGSNEITEGVVSYYVDGSSGEFCMFVSADPDDVLIGNSK